MILGVRAVLDMNVIVSAVLSSHGAPARILQTRADGPFEIVVSRELISELRRVLAYPKIAAESPRRTPRSSLRGSSAGRWCSTMRKALRWCDPPTRVTTS